jgi:hypothetical protein
MKRIGLFVIVVISVLLAAGCGGEECRPHRWKLPPDQQTQVSTDGGSPRL